MSDEKDRLAAVNRFTQLNPDVAADLSQIVELAAQICNTPVALITLVDEHVQWFKAAKGVDMEGTARQLAFCNHTIKQNGLLVIPNTTNDIRFCDNPLVAEAPHVRFYAGATLTTNDGFNIGSLCVIDMEERELSDIQLQTLKTLSKQVMRLMELNLALQLLEDRNTETERQKKYIEESELKLQAIFDSSKDTHVLVDENLAVLAFNKAAHTFVLQEHARNLQSGISILELAPHAIVKQLKKFFTTAFTGKIIETEWNINPGETNERWREVVFTPITGPNGKIIGVALNSSDITERKMQEDHINIQNAALTRIAIIQSHELRRPVASLLGIMALIKLEQTQSDDQYLRMLEYTVKELDQKICEIVKESEDIINNYLQIVA